MKKKKVVKYKIPKENYNILADSGTKNRVEYFRHKKTVLFKGDVLNRDTFDKPFIDLIVTSPPYNVGIDYTSNNKSYEKYKFSKKWMSNVFNWSNTQTRFILNIPLDKNKGGQQSVGSDLTAIAKQVGWKYHSTIIWNEGNISRRTAWGSSLSASAPYVIAPVELIVIMYKSNWKKTNGAKVSIYSRQEFMDWTNGLWTFNGESKKAYWTPTNLPRQLPHRAIKLFSYVNDVVFDPFAGSGTTLIEACNNKRMGIGLEIDKQYCKVYKSSFKRNRRRKFF